MTEERSTSPWLWVAVGCGLAILVAVSALGVLGYLGVKKARQMGADLDDPAKQAAKVTEILGTTELPEGYHPIVGMEIPWVMETAILSDEPPGEAGPRPDLGEQGLVYVAVRDLGHDRDDLRRFLAGEQADAEALRRTDVDLDLGEALARGRFEIEGVLHRWSAHRGGVESPAHGADRLTTLVLLECPASERLHLGIWFAPDPAPDPQAPDADRTGSPADPAAIEAFFAHFRPCGRP